MLEGILKHAEAKRETVSVEGPDISNLEDWLKASEHAKERDKDANIPGWMERLDSDIKDQEKKIELARNLKIKCTVEIPQGFVMGTNEQGLPEYRSAFPVVYTIEENGGETRTFETTGHVNYSNRPGSSPYVVGEPRKNPGSEYMMSYFADQGPWPTDEAGEENHLKNSLAKEIFDKAIRARKTAPDFFVDS